MKKLRLIISVVVILLLLAVSTVGMFSLPTNNVDDRKASVAVINEDSGTIFNGRTILYGSDFAKLFTRNTKAQYEVTSRTAALEGLNSGKYNVAVIVPKDFSQKAMTFDSTQPEVATLEYIKSPSSSQVEALKSEVVAKELKEAANKALIETFTLEILKTMQDMQGKSLDIIDNELQYQTHFKDNVEKPVADSMADFNILLSQFSSQQDALNHFDTSVLNFNGSVQEQTEEEKQHLADFTALKKQYEETSKILKEWTGDYNTTLKSMTDDDHLNKLGEAQKAGLEKMTQLIDELKLRTVNLEFQIRGMEAYKNKIQALQNAYQAAETGAVTYLSDNDGVDDDLDKEINAKLAALAGQVDTLVKPGGGIATALESVTKFAPQDAKAAFEGEFAKACSILPRNLQTLPDEYSSGRFGDAKSFCDKANLATDMSSIPATRVVYEQTSTDFWTGFSTKINVTKSSQYITAKYKRYIKKDSKLEAEGTISNSGETTFGGKAEDTKTVHTSLTYHEEVEVPDGKPIMTNYTPTDSFESFVYYTGSNGGKLDKIFSNIEPKLIDASGNVIGHLRPKQREAIESIQQIEALANVYYGMTPAQLIAAYDANNNKSSVLPSDVNLGITGQTSGIQKFRPYANIVSTGKQLKNATGADVDAEWTGSLIARIEKVFDYNTLKVEVTKALATQLRVNTGEVVTEVTHYIDALKEKTDGALNGNEVPDEIYTDTTKTKFIDPKVEYYQDRDIAQVKPESYNATIAKMMLEKKQAEELAGQIDDFSDVLKDWISDYADFSNDALQITRLHESENRIVVQLDERQKQLLEGVGNLQKQVNTQLDETKQIMTDADKLKRDSENSKVKIEEYTAKLQETKKKFDDTVSDNGNFVDSFVKKYSSALNGGADNQSFYQNYAKPVELMGTDVYNSNSLVSFFIILLITIFALVIAYFFNQWRIRKVASSEHQNISIFAGLATQLSLVVLTAIAAAVIIGYIGVQALDMKNVNTISWFAIILGISIAFTMAFYMLLLRFKTYGMLSIGLMMLLYFITNGALGLNIMKNSTLMWLQWINPLIYFEKPLQNVIFQQEANLFPIFTVLLFVTIGSVVVIYVLQPLVYKQEMKESE